jgi:nucleoid DNA-binding protein
MLDRDMPRRAVVSKIAEEHGVTKIEAEKILRTALSAVADQIALRGRFHMAEVGSITFTRREPRRYFNPRTRADAVSDGDIALKIRISKSMRSRLDKADPSLFDKDD